MKHKIGVVFQWFFALMIVFLFLSMVYTVIKFFHDTSANNDVVTDLVKECQAKNGKIELVQWKYGCARLENGGERQVSCQVLECIQL